MVNGIKIFGTFTNHIDQDNLPVVYFSLIYDKKVTSLDSLQQKLTP